MHPQCSLGFDDCCKSKATARWRHIAVGELRTQTQQWRRIRFATKLGLCAASALNCETLACTVYESAEESTHRGRYLPRWTVRGGRETGQREPWRPPSVAA